MRFFPRSFWTCSLCGLLGAGVGMWNRPATPSAEPPAAPKRPRQAVVASLTTAPATAPQATNLYDAPPAFTSVTASLEWVWKRMKLGDTAAAEELFLQGAGLTDAQRLKLAAELVQNFRRMDPRVLARIVMSLPRGGEEDRALWRLCSEWSASDAEAALLFMETLPADRLNTVGVLTNSAFGLAQLPAERVAAFAARLDDQGRSNLAEGLVGFADQAGSWRNTSAILSQMNVSTQNEVGSLEWQLGSHLAHIDPPTIENLITAESDPLKRDELLGGYAWMVGLNDPQRGIEMDAQIQRPELRAKNLNYHAIEWLECDRAAALAWLQSDTGRQLMSREERAKHLRHYGLEAAP